MGAKRTLYINVTSHAVGGIQANLRSIGTTPSDLLRKEDDPSWADLDATIASIKKLNKCTFSWYPGAGPGGEATTKPAFFRDSMKAKEALHSFILILSVEGYGEGRAHLKEAKVQHVSIDPRNGEEMVQLTCKSVEVTKK
jgi:hypothetical protein